MPPRLVLPVRAGAFYVTYRITTRSWRRRTKSQKLVG
jgi:hypothetical protein